MDYRAVPCSECASPSVGPCARCTEPSCAEHAGVGWCSRCETERTNELEMAVAEAVLQGHVMIENRNGTTNALTLLPLLLNVVGRPFRVVAARKRAQRAFETLRPEDVRAARKDRLERGSR